MHRLGRSFWLLSAAIAYVCFAALQSENGILPWLALLALPLGLAEVWRRTAGPSYADARTHETARAAIRAAAFGALLWCAARSGPAGHSGFDAAANAGAGIAAVAGLVALARMSSLGGALAPHAATRSLDAAAFAALFWSIAAALPSTRALLGTDVRIDPLAIDYATTTAAVASLLLLVAATWRARSLRRLEIGVADRAAGALALAMTSVFVAVPAAALDVAPPDRVLPLAVIGGSLSITWAATTREPTSVSSALRSIVALMILGAPTTTAAGLLARSSPEHAGIIVLGASCLSIAIGLVAERVARPLGPEQSRFLDAIAEASKGALEPEPDAALRSALMALSAACTVPGSRAELWRNDPEEVLSVDVAGYLHVEKGQAPARLYELALGEPERTLRSEALRALEVRRPEVRPLLAWFEARRALSATLILDADGALGFILLPVGNRTSPMTLEEARGMRLLADRLSALFAVSSALARSRERELLAIAERDRAADQCERLEHIVHHELERRTEQAERLAARLRACAYSPGARSALERLERLGRLHAPVTLIAPPGVDAIPWAAVVHLFRQSGKGSFFVVDATAAYERRLQTWQNSATSPLTQAEGGSLVILDLPALPEAVQEHIALTLSRRSAEGKRSNVDPPGLIVSTRIAVAELVTQGRVARSLARWLGDTQLSLPRLQDRAEDLRALILETLSRAGLRDRGEALGIDPQALALLTEHSWPGNDLELEHLLNRSAALANAPCISVADLAGAGFRLTDGDDALATVAEAAPRRARRAPRSR